MHLSRPARVALRLVTAVVLAFVYLPLLVVVINSFNPARVADWPPDGFTADWWARAWDNPGARAALWTSVKAAAGATVVALVLGTLLSFAVQRHRFFGRETLSLLVVLPIALPGIVTGMRHRPSVPGVPLSCGHRRRQAPSASWWVKQPLARAAGVCARWRGVRTGAKASSLRCHFHHCAGLWPAPLAFALVRRIS